MLATRAAKTHHQVGEAPLDIALYRCVDKCIAMVEEGENLAVVFQKLNYRLVEAYIGLVAVVLAWVVACAAIKHIAAAIARGIVGNAFLVGKTHDFHREHVFLYLVGKLRHVYKIVEHLVEIGVFLVGVLEQFAQVVDCKRHALHEMRFFSK